LNLMTEFDTEFWGWAQASGSTEFRVACSAGDYEECMDLIERNGWPANYQLAHPTIMAERDGELIGMMGLRIVDGETPLAGPLALRPGKRRPVLAWKLLVQFEAAVRAKGLTEIIFDVDLNSEMDRLVRKALPNIRPFWIHNDVAHYVWNFAEPDQKCEWAA
jgi:hypothetical protein